jgi:hypothetical protein
MSFPHHPHVQPARGVHLLLLFLPGQGDEGQVEEGVYAATDRALLVLPQPPEDASGVELVRTGQLEVSLVGLGLHQTDSTVDLSLGRSRLHTMSHPRRIHRHTRQWIVV